MLLAGLCKSGQGKCEQADVLACTALHAAAADAAPPSAKPGAASCRSVAGWTDKWGSCKDYGKRKWCMPGGRAGSGWRAAWGDVNATGALSACCACGGGDAT